MKKLLSFAICLAMILGVIAAGAVTFFAVESGDEIVAEDTSKELAVTGASEELSDVGGAQDIADTGAVTAVNLGDSFYARIRMTNYSACFFTVPAAVTDTPILRPLNDYNSQVWHFTRIGSTYRIRSVATNRYLEMKDSAPSERGMMDFTATESNALKQRWVISKDTTGYKIHSSIDSNYVFICVNPTATKSYVILTTSVNNKRSYFNIEKLPITADLLDTPVVKPTSAFGGVQVSWNSIKNATQYRVYRFNDSTNKWVRLTDTKENTYLDKTASSGVTYQYTVKTISPVLSNYKAASVKYIAAPVAKVNNTASGPSIYWSKVAGAEGYRVFYHNGAGWKTLGTTTETSFLHKNFEYHKEYRYTVRCVSADGKSFTSAYDTEGVKNTIVETPVVSASVMPFSVDLKWPKIEGASKYRVFVKGQKTDYAWKAIADTSDTSYSFADAVSDNNYYFTVRAMDENGAINSGFKASRNVAFYEAPCIFDITTTSNTRKLSWYPVEGAARYRVFSWNGQKWTTKGDTASTTYSAAISGSDKQNLCYAVRCTDSAGKFISYYVETVLESDLRYYYPGEYTSKKKF